MNRIEILEKASKLTGGDRNNIYGDPKINMRNFAGLLTAYFEIPGMVFTAEDASIIMVLAKISRIGCGKPHEDNYCDGAAYFGIAGECVEADPRKTPIHEIQRQLPPIIITREEREASLKVERERVAKENRKAATARLPGDIINAE